MNDYKYDFPFDEESKQKRLQEIKRRRLEQQKKDRCQAIAFLVIVGLIILLLIVWIVTAVSKSGNTENGSVYVPDKIESDIDTDTEGKSNNAETVNTNHKVEVKDGITYVDGIMIVNKSYSLPEEYDPGLNAEAFEAFNKMIKAASDDGLFIYLQSGYRSYADQNYLYNQYADERGTDEADKVSARPGYSEHQTGLAIDVNYTDFSFGDTAEGKWLAEHCSEYGFIIRYPEDKEEQTGFAYEPWHIRYLGVETAKKVTESGLCLEEYLGVTSEYNSSQMSPAS